MRCASVSVPTMRRANGNAVPGPSGRREGDPEGLQAGARAPAETRSQTEDQPHEGGRQIPAQGRAHAEGNRYFRGDFPKLDHIKSAELVAPAKRAD